MRMHARASTCASACMRKCACVCMHVHVCASMLVCVCMCVPELRLHGTYRSHILCAPCNALTQRLLPKTQRWCGRAGHYRLRQLSLPGARTLCHSADSDFLAVFLPGLRRSW